MLDVGSLADDSGYLDLGVTLVSPDENLLAYSVDTTGEEVFALRFRDLRTGADLDEVVPRSYYRGAWSADSAYFFYTVHDRAYRPHQVWRHRIGTPVADDVLVLEEPDERFELTVRASRSGEVVLLRSESRDTGEEWAIDARDTGVGAALGRRAPAGGALPRRAPARPGPCCWSPTTTPSSSGWSRRPSRPPTRTTPPGDRCAPRTRRSGSSGWTPSPATWS